MGLLGVDFSDLGVNVVGLNLLGFSSGSTMDAGVTLLPVDKAELP